MTGAPKYQVDVCTGCSLINGKAMDPICYLEAEFEDPETGFEVQCPNCETHIYGETPEAAVINWNRKQREVLGDARRYLATLAADADPEPSAPRL